MADYRAIETAGKALIHLLRTSYTPGDFNDLQLQFEVYVAENYTQPMSAGISLFLYRITTNGSHRIPAGRMAPGGKRYRTQLPLDLHYLMTIWAQDAALQHRLAGWMMRTIEDTPILPIGLLDTVTPGVFRSDETLEVVPAELANEDLLRIWETLVQSGYKLSIPYLVRNVRIESSHLVTEGAPVQERQVGWKEVEAKIATRN